MYLKILKISLKIGFKTYFKHILCCNRKVRIQMTKAKTLVKATQTKDWSQIKAW
jgi:hypothetical protein